MSAASAAGPPSGVSDGDGATGDAARLAWDRAHAATDPADATRWLERAHRLLPIDDAVAVALAGALLRTGNVVRARQLFGRVAERHGTAEGWAGLAAATHLLGQHGEARAALGRLLQASAMTDAFRNLAAAVAGSGWCGLTLDGVLWAGPGRAASVVRDGRPVRLRWTRQAARLPAGWEKASEVTVEAAGAMLLGSPLPIRHLIAVEGLAEASGGGVQGWAWHPADPGRPPRLVVAGPRGRRTVVASDQIKLPCGNPLARPRRYALPAAVVAELGSPLAVQGPDGRHLLGSPLDPGAEDRAAKLAPGAFGLAQASAAGAPASGTRRQAAVDVIVPVFKGEAETLACLRSVLAGTGRGVRVVVVDDASPDPTLVAGIAALARRHLRLTILRLPENRGFPAAVNAGIALAAGRDVVLLNSDTLVPLGWLDRLRAAAYSAPDVGTVSPLSNDATILSYPDRNGGNPVPDGAGTTALDVLAQKANGSAVVDIPVGVGFCLYIRRACLDAVGGLREDLFAQGYGEENDLCLRARGVGWRSVAAPGVFVSHVGAASFGGAREHLVRRNTAILNRLHPGHDALIADHLANDPLLPARRRLDALRWSAGRRDRAVVLITHADGGGVERVVQDRAAETAAAGQRAILLRPAPGRAVRVEEPGQAFPSLVFPMPGKLDALVRLLRADHPVRVELHHMLGHAHEIAGLAGRLGAEAVSVVHDYARFCPRIALVGPARCYCGEPDLAGCEACVAEGGSRLKDDPPIPELLARSAAELRAATQVIAPSADAARRIARHFPGLRPTVQPWEQDRAWSRPAPQPGSTLRVVVVGAIGVEKGFQVLLDCVRDARARDLPMGFTVVGFTADDEHLMAAGPAFVTGPYAEHEAVTLIRAQGGHLALIPSVWPETWCFALSRAWEAGLPAVVFDLGAQAERVRATGGGTVLPLSLGAAAVNDALLRLARPQPPSHCRAA